MKAKQLTTMMLASLLFIFTAQANKTYERRFYETTTTKDIPIIDGILNDAVWLKGQWQGGFTQREPRSGVEPSQKTEFQIVYDNDYLYIGIKAYDNEPDSVMHRVSRRDDIDGDAVGLAIDSYHDKQTAFGFWVNAAGVKKDFIITNDGDYEDQNWDPIWWVRTAKSNEGWTAEMKIPLNQLRFAGLDDLTWGLQVGRYLFRKQESSYWQFVPKDASGWIHNFGEMNGLKGLTPKRQIEVAPYVVTKAERYKKEVGNPFMTGNEKNISVGADAKIGLTNNFILDLTVNPDFGQVEADPSVVNLTAFETYFEEKRPFFVEGRNLFNFNLMGGDGDGSLENLFYSRRIGRSPQLYPDNVSDNAYVEIPSNTTILGAAKLSGRTNNGLSVGVMESLTLNNYANISDEGKRSTVIVEPLTNYFVGTVKKEFNKGNTIVNSIFTSTNRQLTDVTKDYLHKDAFTGGLDLQQYWKNKNYFFNLKMYFSNVQGTKNAIAATQNSPLRYFQRTDIKHVSLDSSRTSLTGAGGLMQFGKVGEGHVRYMSFLSWKSPQLEINDIGYSQSVDDVFEALWLGIRYWEPFFIFRSFNINFNQWNGWNFAKENTYKGGNINLNFQFKNYWGISAGMNRNGERLSNSALRGGPMLKLPGNWNSWYNISSDQRKSLTFTIGGSNNWGDEGYNRSTSYFAFINYKPSKKISLSLVPEYSYGWNKMQYVANTEMNGIPRYINASINRKSYEISLRLEYSVNPELTFQYYARPYLSSVSFFDYKYVNSPKANKFKDRFVMLDATQLTFDKNNNVCYVNEDGGSNDYSFDLWDQNFLDFQSTFIARWEYRPGSTLFFVWTMNKQDFYQTPSTSINNDVSNLYDTNPYSVFLVKFAYRFN